MENLRTIQQYVRTMRCEIGELKDMSYSNIIDKNNVIDLEVELEMLIVISGVDNIKCLMKYSSKSVQDNKFEGKTKSLITYKNLNDFKDLAKRIHNVFNSCRDKVGDIIETGNKRRVSDILATIKRLIIDLSKTIKNFRYNITANEEEILYKFKKEFFYILTHYKKSNKDELEELAERTKLLKDNISSFAVEIIDNAMDEEINKNQWIEEVRQVV